MNNNENIIKDIVVLDELGVDTSRYGIPASTMSDAFYELYCSSCQSNDRNSFEFAEDYVIGNQVGQLTASGRKGVFRWYALTTYYGTDIYKIDEEKQRQNTVHRETMQKGSYELGVLINHALNSSEVIHDILRDPIVFNSNVISDVREYRLLTVLQRHLELFMDIPHCDIAAKENNKISYNWSLIRDKDVIIPYICGTQKNIKLFAEIASELCGTQKASCAIGFFITRFKPSLDGKETHLIDPKDRIPVISENPFFTPIV